MLPQKRVIRDGYVFATKHVNPGQFKSLLDWFATFVIQFIFIEFGLNVNVPWLKSPHWNIEFRIWAKCTGVWGKITPNETGCFNKALPNVRSAYVTLQDFTPDPQKNYTDISAISVTFLNSGPDECWSRRGCRLPVRTCPPPRLPTDPQQRPHRGHSWQSGTSWCLQISESEW